MSDCSTHRDEFPGVKRIIVHFTDPNEHDFEWPFVPLEREIESIEVDGEMIGKIKMMLNAEFKLLEERNISLTSFLKKVINRLLMCVFLTLCCPEVLCSALEDAALK